MGTSGWEGPRWLPDAGAVTFERSWRTRPRLRDSVQLCHATSGCRQRKAKPPRYRGKVGAELSRGSQRDAAPCRMQSASLGGAAGAGSWLWLVSVRLLNAVKRAHTSVLGMATCTYPSTVPFYIRTHQKKFYPSGYSYILADIKFYSYPYSRGYFYPSGNPYPLEKS